MRHVELRRQIDLRIRARLRGERVVFCRDCFEPFDVEPRRGAGAPPTVCPDCRKEHKAVAARIRYYRTKTEVAGRAA